MPAPLASGALRVLSQKKCVALLKSHSFGRVAAGLEGWPAILPVNYVYDRTSVVFRTGEGAKLDEIPMRMVAFEIDDADPDGAWGWSVLVQGPAFDVTSSIDDTSKRLRSQPVVPWAPGPKSNWIRIASSRISGRSFGDCVFAASVPTRSGTADS